MNRPIIYPLEEIRSYDTLMGWRYAMIGAANLAQNCIGGTGTVLQGFVASQHSPASLVINLTEGMIYSDQAVDSTVYGNLDADPTLIMQQGYKAASTLTFNTSGLSGGQSKWALVQVKFSQTDVIPADDPNEGIVPYINPADPTNPFSGPNNSNEAQDTARLGVATVSIKYGAPATSGSNVPPTADADYVPLYLIDLSFGQTTITDGEILIAGPDAYPLYDHAPIWPGVTGSVPGSSGSHHGGIAGQANKILFTNGAEIQGIAPFANLPVSNATPPSVGGIVTVAGDIPIISQGTSIPTGNLAGNVNDLYLDLTGNLFWVCTTSGNAAAAVWAAIGSAGITQYKNASFTAQPGFCYVCDTSGGDITVTLGAVATYGGVPIAFKNWGTNAVILTPGGSDAIEQQANGATFALYNKGEFVRLSPTASPANLFLIT